MKAKATLLVFLFIGTTVLFAQSTWMGNRVTKSNIYLDPTEIQMSGSITGLQNKNKSQNQYLPFGIGIGQSIYAVQLEENKAWEIVGEMGVFTQFEWKEVDGKQQRNLINTDYKIAFSFIKQLNNRSTYRIRGFHVSSHLGDDYIIRNDIASYTENKVNYEQIEFTYFYQLIENKLNTVIGLGSVIRPNALRLPFSYTLGLDYTAIKLSKNWGLTSGFVFKGFQETNFNLNVKASAGIAYQNQAKKQPIRIVIEYYTGHLPYSQFEQNKIEWFGLGLYFNI